MLKSLYVKNLGPIEEATLDGSIPVNLLLGPNESGKTTLCEALEVLYFGTRGGIEVKSNAALVHAGAKGFKVEATFDDDTVFTATRSKRPLREDLAKRLGDPRVFAAISKAGVFLTMKPADRKQLLADLAASDTLALADALEERGVDASIVKAVRAGNMRRAHSLATDLRRAEDRKINAVEAIANTEVVDTEVKTKKGALAISGIPLETIETGLDRLSKRRDEIKSASYRVEAHERIIRDMDAAREELADLQAEAAWSEGDDSTYMALGRELDDSRAACMEAATVIKTASVLDEELRVLLEAGGACPTCHGDLGTAKAKKAMESVRNACAGRMGDTRKIQTEGAAKSHKLEERRKEMLGRKQEAVALTATRARLEQKIEVGEASEKPDVPAGDLTKLGSEISRLMVMRDARRDFDTKMRDKATAVERLGELTGPRDEYAKLEKELDPSAIADEKALVTDFNGHLARTCGKLGVPVVLNDGYDLSIHGRPVGLAARSAALRAGFGVACALSVLSGVGYAVLDDFEALDDDNRKRVLGLLKGLTDDGLLSWVLIAAVKKDPKAGANVPWLSWISVADGTATYLEA